MSKFKTLIIVPAFNESGNIGKTVAEIRKIAVPVDILVVNDGSKDATAAQAKAAGAKVISLPFNLGIGGAVQTGFKFAYKHRYDIAVQVDGDGQHDTAYLLALLAPIVEEHADMTVGSRFLNPTAGYRSSFVRRIGIHFFAHLLSFLTQCKITDSTSGFRAYNRRAIEIYARYYPQDYPEPEAIVVAKRLGLQIVEVPVAMRERQSGHSSIRYLMTLYYMIKVTLAILLDMLKKQKILQ